MIASSKGELRHQPGHVIDLWPTLTGLAGVRESSLPEGVPARPGVALQFGPSDAHAERELWWAHEGNRALRVGDWKLVAAKGDPWALYDLKTDRAEQKNLASQNPDKVRELTELWEQRSKEFQQQAHTP